MCRERRVYSGGGGDGGGDGGIGRGRDRWSAEQGWWGFCYATCRLTRQSSLTTKGNDAVVESAGYDERWNVMRRDCRIIMRRFGRLNKS
jgi:hypothetical protein